MASPAIDLASAPMGANLVSGGAVFRIWAPRAKMVWVSGDFNSWKQDSTSQLQQIGGGQWAGFFPGLKEGDQYLFYIQGQGSTGYKRDPRARELTFQPGFPFANCLLRDPSHFPWHDSNFRTPPFNDLVIYQLHVGTFSPRSQTHGRFLDVALRLPYLSALGINAIEPLPVVEYPTTFSLGYNGTDYYSPENDYAESDDSPLQQYFDQVNALLRSRGQAPYANLDVLRGADNQLRALVDLCHVFGIAILFDVVYNHAGGGFDENSMWFLDRMPFGNPNDSLYFTDHGWAGGQIFAYWNQDVQQLLIDNARSFYDEYHIDGLRYDEVSVMHQNGGWQTCQAITDTLHFVRPGAIQIAEHWPVEGDVVSPTSPGGGGFDATWSDGLRDSVRAAIEQSSTGSSAQLNLDAIANAIQFPGLRDRWRSVQCVENHDLVIAGRELRVARLSDPSNARSWYARSRSRVGFGLLLTAPGIPMLFMGQEFLEDKQWSDTPSPANLIWWAGLEGGDKTMGDFLRFTQEGIALRHRLPALRAEGCQVLHVHNQNRVLAFQRWVENAGQDVIVVASFNESNLYNYSIGFPGAGRWLEVFNSDVYDNWVNPITAGNGGAVEASGPPMHGLPNSASLAIPANGLLVFARN